MARECTPHDVADSNSFSPLPADDAYISAGFQNDVRMSYCASVVADVIDAGSPTQAPTDFIGRCKVRV
jgi:hypothetical protein